MMANNLVSCTLSESILAELCHWRTSSSTPETQLLSLRSQQPSAPQAIRPFPPSHFSHLAFPHCSECQGHVQHPQHLPNLLLRLNQVLHQPSPFLTHLQADHSFSRLPHSPQCLILQSFQHSHKGILFLSQPGFTAVPTSLVGAAKGWATECHLLSKVRHHRCQNCRNTLA